MQSAFSGCLRVGAHRVRRCPRERGTRDGPPALRPPSEQGGPSASQFTQVPQTSREASSTCWTLSSECGPVRHSYVSGKPRVNFVTGDFVSSLPPLVEPADSLTIDEVKRYSRHIIIPEVAMAGQKRLKNARVLAIGAGGLG